MLDRAIARYRGLIFYRGTPSRALHLTHDDLAALDARRAAYAARPPFHHRGRKASKRSAPPRPTARPSGPVGGRSAGGVGGVGGAATMALAGLVIRVAGSAALSVGVDESYTLDITNASATITAPNQWGALRGLETFSQTVFCLTAAAAAAAAAAPAASPTRGGQKDGACGGGSGGGSVTTAGCVYAIQNLPLHIADTARFPHRGIMVDSSRHFIPVRASKHTLPFKSPKWGAGSFPRAA